MPHFSRLLPATLVVSLSVVPAALLRAQGPGKSAPVFVDGQAQVVQAFADSTQWIRQELWVQTDFDTDHDGKPDRMHVDVTRPRQTETEGLKVPVVMGSSPYYAGTARHQVNWDVQVELGTVPPPRGHMEEPPFTSPRPRISNALVNEWVPRGFAVVHSEAPGTGLSSGCPTVGGYPEREAPAAVIRWLNGRAKGYTTKTGNVEVKATWTTGKVGMIGTSYEGTLPLAAATTGVKGLEVVIPVSPNTSYYHYYRTNGLVRSPGGYLGEDVDVLYDFIASGDTANRATCDRIWKNGIFAGHDGQDRRDGDMNQFWLDRDLLPHVKNIKAAVLLAHGFNDYNVVPEHSLRIFNEMKKDGLPVSIYFHTGGHGGNPPAAMVNRWFSHYLYGVDNGVQNDPPVWIVQDAGMQDPEGVRRLDSLKAYLAAHPPQFDTTTPRGRREAFFFRRFGPRLDTPPTPFASFPVPGSVPVVF
ncbi:MAG: CocE/NonD family hydrolase, partial [Gemmatimonadaceae bacterium]